MNYKLQVTSYVAGSNVSRSPGGNSSLVTRNFNPLLVAILCILPSACSAPRRSFVPPVDAATLDDTAFLHYLPTVPTATLAEGVRAVLTLLGPSSNWPTWDEQIAHLQSLGAVKDAWRLAPEDTLDHGTLAFMLTAVVRMPTSLNQRIASFTGIADRRAAFQICIDEGLLPHALPHDPVPGGELLTAIVRASERAHVPPGRS